MSGIEAAKQRILSRVSLVDLVGQHLTLSRRSGHPVGLCPFHVEKSPSFTIYGDRYFCFGCKVNGDAIDFVRHVVGLGFIDALKYLSEKFSVEAPELEQSSHWRGHADSKGALYRCMAGAQEFFVSSLRSPEGAEARKYLEGRGFSEEEIAAYGFGFAPGVGDLNERVGPGANCRLITQLVRTGFKEEDLLAASLAWVNRRDEMFDFFRGRLMIPIKDAYGRIIAFGGRTLGSDQPKYLNSKESPLFDKGRVLFGLDRAKSAIREKRRVIVVEGYMDAIKMWSSGFSETVACLGTALTVSHLRSLEPLTNAAFLLFDGDVAGEKASLKAVGIALEVPKVNIRVMELPDGKDPDDFVKEQGADAVLELMANSTGILEFAIRETLAGVEKLEVPKAVREQFVPWLSRVEDPIQRGFLLSRVAQWTGISQTALEKELADNATIAAAAQLRRQDVAVEERTGVRREVRDDRERATAPPMIVEQQARSLTALEFEVLAHLYFATPEDVVDAELMSGIARSLRWDEPWRTLFETILTALRAGKTPSAVEPAEILGASHPRLFDEIEKFRLAEEAFRCNDRAKRLGRLLKELRARAIRDSVGNLRRQLAVVAGPDQSRPIIQAIQELNQELTLLSATGDRPGPKPALEVPDTHPGS